mmetsp:Transcript_42194/g.116464  ORF Transcript_42194/g.116464 Transcript_42194/m.116464 type:complete len:279 (-) Transcript_42194:2-838(-)
MAGVDLRHEGSNHNNRPKAGRTWPEAKRICLDGGRGFCGASSPTATGLGHAPHRRAHRARRARRARRAHRASRAHRAFNIAPPLVWKTWAHRRTRHAAVILLLLGLMIGGPNCIPFVPHLPDKWMIQEFLVVRVAMLVDGRVGYLCVRFNLLFEFLLGAFSEFLEVLQRETLWAAAPSGRHGLFFVGADPGLQFPEHGVVVEMEHHLPSAQDAAATFGKDRNHFVTEFAAAAQRVRVEADRSWSSSLGRRLVLIEGRQQLAVFPDELEGVISIEVIGR